MFIAILCPILVYFSTVALGELRFRKGFKKLHVTWIHCSRAPVIYNLVCVFDQLPEKIELFAWWHFFRLVERIILIFCFVQNGLSLQILSNWAYATGVSLGCHCSSQPLSIICSLWTINLMMMPMFNEKKKNVFNETIVLTFCLFYW